DAPLAERRAQALTIDFERLHELLGESEIRSLLDPEILADHARYLQRLSRPATHLDGVHDLLLAVGDLTRDELRARCSPAEAADGWVDALRAAKRIIDVRVGGEGRLAAVEDAARLRDALGTKLPPGLPAALLDRAPTALHDLLSRYARTHGPFAVADVAVRFGLEDDALRHAIEALFEEGRLVGGAFLPGGTEPELCDRDVLDALRRRSLAHLRRAVEAVPPEALARLLVDWHGIPRKRRGRDALLAVVAELEGCPLIASALEEELLPARIEGYRGWDLDALCASGEVVWAGVESVGPSDGRIALYLAEHEPLLARVAVPVDGPLAQSIRDVLGRRGAVFFADLARTVGVFPNDVLDVLWQMVWAGEVTNDTLEPMRSRLHALAGEGHRRQHPRHARAPRTGPPGSEGRWSLRTARWGEVPADTDRRAALARSLLDRYGIVTKETAHAEGITGGFAAVYDVLKELENRGRVRRAYFVEGRGGAQFALPGADERLRARREAKEDGEPVVLAATDPASAWGAVLDWPSSAADARPQRGAGALVVLHEGELLGWVGRGDHPVLTFLPADEPVRTEKARVLARALAARADRGPARALLLTTIDGLPPSRSPLLRAFVDAGFTSSAGGLLRRAARTIPPSADTGDASPPFEV
ncbi:MAG TPA: crosslink repair DNA glycosylase YcaQ family protein, partial [Polyangiaceae bacterium]